MKKDELYAIIEEEGIKGYRLTDNEYGFCHISKDDISDQGGGIFLIRFRIPIEQGSFGINSVARDVAKRTGMDSDVFTKDMEEVYVANGTEFRMKYVDCAWVLSVRQ